MRQNFDVKVRDPMIFLSV